MMLGKFIQNGKLLYSDFNRINGNIHRKAFKYFNYEGK